MASTVGFMEISSNLPILETACRPHYILQYEHLSSGNGNRMKQCNDYNNFVMSHGEKIQVTCKCFLLHKYFPNIKLLSPHTYCRPVYPGPITINASSLFRHTTWWQVAKKDLIQFQLHQWLELLKLSFKILHQFIYSLTLPPECRSLPLG